MNIFKKPKTTEVKLMYIIFGLLLVAVLVFLWDRIYDHLKEKFGVAKAQIFAGIVTLVIMALPWMLSPLVGVHIARTPELGALSALFAAFVVWMILDGFYHQKKGPRMRPN